MRKNSVHAPSYNHPVGQRNMSEKKSTFVFAGAREAQQKFDYFIAGVAGALFAYIAQTYTPKKISFTPASLEPLALVFLALAFFYGMKRIENTVVVMRLNHEMLDAEEKAGSMTEAMASGISHGFNPHSGELISATELPALREFYRQQARSARDQAEVASIKGERFYTRRNQFLFAGFVAIFLTKLLQPYA